MALFSVEASGQSAKDYFKIFFQDSEVSGRTIYSYYAIPYGKAPEGDLRFAPPQAAEPLNDGGYRFDGTYTTYLLGWINKVCPQAGIYLYVYLFLHYSNSKFCEDTKITLCQPNLTNLT